MIQPQQLQQYSNDGADLPDGFFRGAGLVHLELPLVQDFHFQVGNHDLGIGPRDVDAHGIITVAVDVIEDRLSAAGGSAVADFDD